MRTFYRLLQYEFSTWLKAIMLLCTAVIVIPLYLLHMFVKDYGEYTIHERYENIYASSGCIIVFLLCIAAACGFFLKTIYAGYWGSKSIYMFLSLPVRRESIYFSKIVVFVICLLMLLGSQLISIKLGYDVVSAKFASYGEGRFSMTNGLFLAVIRSDFFRIIMPLNLSRILSSASILFMITTALYYGALCERSKRYWGFVAIGAAVIVAIKILSYRMSESYSYAAPSHLYISSSIMLILSGFFIWHSIKLIKKAAIA
ncbi:hypothetical protein MHH56_21995 [Paenibacillus sp. FSL K6-3182]|uniref:hypothetical protein n=1 Tax=Paenibacillus sp. FSL K6-3182 TaxID=2921495 RepID=UPI0030D04F83